MNNLITTANNNTITSIEVAQMIGKEHRFLLRDIHRYINQINKINETKIGESKIALTDFFIESNYITSQNKTQPCYNVTRKGCEFIANKLTGIKGTEFTARYVNKFHELEENNINNTLISTLQNISNTILEIQKSTNERIDKIEELLKSQTSLPTSSTKKLPELKYSRWKSRMFEKLKLLTEYANSNSAYTITLADTLHITINEMQDTYDIELSDYIKDYMLENSSEEKPYDLDVINYYKDIRDLYSSTVDSIMDKLNLKADISSPKNIFDILAQNIA